MHSPIIIHMNCAEELYLKNLANSWTCLFTFFSIPLSLQTSKSFCNKNANTFSPYARANCSVDRLQFTWNAHHMTFFVAVIDVDDRNSKLLENTPDCLCDISPCEYTQWYWIGKIAVIESPSFQFAVVQVHKLKKKIVSHQSQFIASCVQYDFYYHFKSKHSPFVFHQCFSILILWRNHVRLMLTFSWKLSSHIKVFAV